jgi:hypothetical protein
MIHSVNPSQSSWKQVGQCNIQGAHASIVVITKGLNDDVVLRPETFRHVLVKRKPSFTIAGTVTYGHVYREVSGHVETSKLWWLENNIAVGYRRLAAVAGFCMCLFRLSLCLRVSGRASGGRS